MADYVMPRALPDILQPYRPHRRDPWDLRKACHLHRRAAFGAALPDIDEAVKAGFERSIDGLIHIDSKPGELDRFLRTVRTELFDFGDDISQAQAFWLYRCVATERPFAEKMALFWHGHFATANYKVQNPTYMYQQYETLRRHACARFEDLLLRVAQDTAMLLWLDGGVNRKGAPNENFARELLELFTMGAGHYTEDDIKEAARAFTGWQHRDGSFFIDAAQHDDGEKHFLGTKGPLSGEDIVRIVSARPETARFLSRKILEQFVMESPPEEAVAGLADVYRLNDGLILAVMDVVFRSRLFYSPQAYRGLIKSPFELVVGAIRILDANTNRHMALGFMANMGQEPFNPPNVKGWEGGESWVNTVTMIERTNFLNELMLRTGVKVEGRDHLLLQELKDRKLRKPRDIVDYFITYLLQDDVTDKQRRVLEDYCRQEMQKVDRGETDESRDYKLRRIANLVMTMPAYQLN